MGSSHPHCFVTAVFIVQCITSPVRKHSFSRQLLITLQEPILFLKCDVFSNIPPDSWVVSRFSSEQTLKCFSFCLSLLHTFRHELRRQRIFALTTLSKATRNPPGLLSRAPSGSLCATSLRLKTAQGRGQTVSEPGRWHFRGFPCVADRGHRELGSPGLHRREGLSAARSCAPGSGGGGITGGLRLELRGHGKGGGVCPLGYDPSRALSPQTSRAVAWG